ncbi:MAG TPA: hypothetical protein VLA34_05965, partial [Candidatus Krumholzibacterium sp.]|nr:hypothetical protein [Candidatus Krumholzibacterium sp.]
NATVFLDHGALVERPEDASDAVFYRSGGFGIEILSPIQNLVRVELAFAEDNSPEFFVTSTRKF